MSREMHAPPRGGNTPPPIEIRPGRGPGGPMGARLRAEKPKNAKRTVLRLLAYIGRSRMLLFALLFLMLAVTLTELAGPALQQMAIDAIDLKEGHLSVNFQNQCVLF